LKIKVTLFYLSLVVLTYPNLYSQTIKPDSISYRYWIYFKDKGVYKPGDKINEGSEAYKIASSELSSKTLWRRAKVLPPDEIVQYGDIPVNQAYIDQVKNTGVKMVAVSKWFNGVSIRAKRKQLDEIKKFNFVSKIEGVHFLEFAKNISGRRNISPFKENWVMTDKLKYNYGPSYWQNEQIKVPILHYCGITGYGVIVGMCDDGFNWRMHEALRNNNVLAEHDWIFNDDSTLNQTAPNQFPSDAFDQDNHGTSTFSTVGGFYDGKLIGPAFDADFLLSKTEYDPTETPVEEDYWLEAIEWMEAKGVDVVSSSLIYKPFDLPNNGYDYKDMDGKTTVIARAASYAIHLGVVVCNSMGNERQTEPPSIVSPADTDSLIAVGAVDSTGAITYFSSNGPTGDNRIKPDIVAMGEDVWTAVSYTSSWNDSSYSYSSGTSFSCPLTAGVCALLLSAHPELTPVQVRDALRNTADKNTKPDNIFGWGLINAYEAALYSGMMISNKPEVKFADDNIEVAAFVLSKKQIAPDNVILHYTLDGSNDFKEMPMALRESLNETNSGKYSVIIPKGINFDMLKLYITAQDENSAVSSPYNAPGKYFYMTDNHSIKVN
jgi:serine protease AprX